MNKKSLECTRQFEEFLAARGLRLSQERHAVLDEVLSRQGHFDPEELHFALKQGGSKASRASVYRTIPLLVEAGLIEQVERTDKHAHYECTFGRKHHDHMLCMGCGKVVEFLSEPLERLQDDICRKEGFKGVSHTLEIKGYCRKCSLS